MPKDNAGEAASRPLPDQPLGTVAGNATYRYANVSVLAISALEAPIVVTSDEIDERLAPTLRRLRLRPGMLQQIAGVNERRWWPQDVSFADAAATAGAKALAEAGIDPARVGLLINSSVSREHLEPSTAVAVHHNLGLSSSAMNFDVSNACLGFINAMHISATMIDSGQIEYALVVNGEDARRTQEATLARLASPDATIRDFRNEFASLTLGSGAAAAVLGRFDAHHDGHQLLGGIARTASEYHELCIGDIEGMRTDTKAMFDGAVSLATAAWEEARTDWDWQDMDCYAMHQVSMMHTNAIIERLGLNPDRVPVTFPRLGNVGPAALPLTLVQHSDQLSDGDRVLCMGIGSGLNTCVLEMVW
jgi:acyl-CoA:acyl-CoA alkyltransferase